ncbi:MAG: caspase, EACC1-associated type [Nocardioidaceae bacterium]
MAAADRKALLVATYDYRDPGLRRLTAPAHDAEALAEVLQDPDIAGFEVSTLVNQPAHVVGEAIADFYRDCRRDDLTLLYFSGHGVKDDEGRLYLAMSNTRRDALLFTGLSAAQINDAMDACVSRRKVLVLDCCYSGAFPAGHTAKGDDSVHTLERFQGKGRAVLTASDSTQYSFEGETVAGRGTRSLFTRFLVEAIRTGEADLDADGDIALDELYSYVHDRVVATMPQQRPKKQEDVDGRIVLARNVHWTLPAHLRNAIDSPIAAQRLAAVDELAHLHRVGNEIVRAAVARELAALADDDSRAVSAAAVALSTRLGGSSAPSSVPPPRAAPAPESHAAPESVAAAAVGGGSPEPEADVAEEHATGAPAAPSPDAVSPPVAASSPVPGTAVAPAVASPEPRKRRPGAIPGRHCSSR